LCVTASDRSNCRYLSLLPCPILQIDLDLLFQLVAGNWKLILAAVLPSHLHLQISLGTRKVTPPS
jgi:hypothetical protein